MSSLSAFSCCVTKPEDRNCRKSQPDAPPWILSLHFASCLSCTVVEQHLSLHVAYISIETAFDSVDREVLWKVLKGGMSTNLLDLIHELYKGTTTRMRTGNGVSDTFYISGMRQDCILAPALFCHTIDWLMSFCTIELGIDVGQRHFTYIDYADDSLLFYQNNYWTLPVCHSTVMVRQQTSSAYIPIGTRPSCRILEKVPPLPHPLWIVD